jgi:hypothetical protein
VKERQTVAITGFSAGRPFLVWFNLALAITIRAVEPVAWSDEPPRDLAPPVVQGRWIVPAQEKPAEPIWGVDGGIAVGLWPTPGPRGLFRIYAPYLGHDRLRVINFVAIEPIVGRGRGLSELERSDRDGVPGKAMWSGTRRDEAGLARKPWEPTAPEFVEIDGVRALTFYVFVEPFQSGAQPVIQVILREDRPYEVGFRTFAADGSTAMKSCILSATMGNYARLRQIWLQDRVIEARELWPGFVSRDPRLSGFAPHHQWGAAEMFVQGTDAIVAATPDEKEPAEASYAAAVPPWWRYTGKPATQYWRSAHHENLVVRVNGRTTYWGTTTEIPGGVAFENFELESPFKSGQEFWFGVTPHSPAELLLHRGD